MRTCFSSPSEVAHLWAHQIQDEARYSGGNFYFHGNTIYSYGSHFPCGTIVTNLDGEQAYILNSDSYSTTTAKHKAEVWHSLPSSCTYFQTSGCKSPKLTRSGKFLYGYWTAIHVIVDQLMILSGWIEKQKKARSRDYRRDIADTISEIQQWIKFWGLNKKRKWQLHEWNDEHPQMYSDVYTLFKKKNIALEIHTHCEISTNKCLTSVHLFNLLCSTGCIDLVNDAVCIDDVDNLLTTFWGEDAAKDLENKLKKCASLERQRVRKQAKDKIKRDKDRLKKWHEHDRDVYSWHPSYEFEKAMGWHTALRIDKDSIATSKGVNISFAEAKRLWGLIQAFHNGTPFRHDLALSLSGTSWKLNSYENDVLTAGCHKIPYSECERIANLMNW